MLGSDIVLAVDFFFILIFLLKTNHDFGRWKRPLFDNLFSPHLQKMYIKKLV